MFFLRFQGHNDSSMHHKAGNDPSTRTLLPFFTICNKSRLFYLCFLSYFSSFHVHWAHNQTNLGCVGKDCPCYSIWCLLYPAPSWCFEHYRLGIFDTHFSLLTKKKCTLPYLSVFGLSFLVQSMKSKAEWVYCPLRFIVQETGHNP